jgi:hypothetical protein
MYEGEVHAHLSLFILWYSYGLPEHLHYKPWPLGGQSRSGNAF